MCSNKEFLNPQISIEKEACLGRDTVVAIIEEGQKIKIVNFLCLHYLQVLFNYLTVSNITNHSGRNRSLRIKHLKI